MKYELEQTAIFRGWLGALDASIRVRVISRLARIEGGNFGDHKEIAANLFEPRCFFGGGIRMYYTVRGSAVVLMLVGGGKGTQRRDIETAGQMLKEMED